MLNALVKIGVKEYLDELAVKMPQQKDKNKNEKKRSLDNTNNDTESSANETEK